MIYRMFMGCLASVAVLSVTASAADLADLQGYWSFDNDANLGEDSGPNGNQLTPLAGGTPTFFAGGKFGGAVDFDGPGSNDPLTSAAFPTGIPTGDNSYSVYAWANPDDNNPGGGGIISWGNNSNNEKNATRLAGTNGYRHYWWSNDLDTGDVGSNQLTGDPPDGWHQEAVTSDAATDAQIFYVDGVVEASRTATGLNSQATNFFIGRAADDGENFNGKLDDVAVFSDVLTPEQITALYNNGDGLSVGALFAPVPEPASVAIWSLLGLSALVYGFYRRRMKK